MTKQEQVKTTIPMDNSWHTEDLDNKANNHDMNKSQFIFMALNTFYNLSDDFIKRMQQYADYFHVPVNVVIENLIIDKFAKEHAEAIVYGDQKRIRHEFISISDNQGSRMLTGKELERHLIDLYKREFEAEKEQRTSEPRKRYEPKEDRA